MTTRSSWPAKALVLGVLLLQVLAADHDPAPVQSHEAITSQSQEPARAVSPEGEASEMVHKGRSEIAHEEEERAIKASRADLDQRYQETLAQIRTSCNHSDPGFNLRECRSLNKLLRLWPIIQCEVALAYTIVGFVLAVASLFYFVSNSDVTVKAYSWEMIWLAVSIFVAVQIFGALQNVFEVYLLNYLWIPHIISVFVSWLGVQGSLLAASRLEGAPIHHISRQVVACKTFGTLTSHMSGFAWVGFWYTVQDLCFVRGITIGIPAAVIGSLLLKLVTLRTSKAVRQGLGTLKQLREEDHEAWDAEAVEAEVDAGAVVLSYLSLQALRYYDTGLLPYSNGIDRIGRNGQMPDRKVEEATLILALTLLSQLILNILLRFVPQMQHQRDEREGCEWWLGTACTICLRSLSFIGGWTFFTASCWFFEGVWGNRNDSRMIVCISVAMLCTYSALAAVWVLAKLLRLFLQRGRHKRRQVTENLIQMFGLSIGFSWERCFDFALDRLAVRAGFAVTSRHHANASRECIGSCKSFSAWMSLACTVLIVMVVMPAAHWSIVPKVLAAQSMAKEERLIQDLLKESVSEDGNLSDQESERSAVQKARPCL